MAKSSRIPDEIFDRLYGGPPDEFVRLRNAAAKELKQADDDEAAQAVRALRRPAAPAAAINRAVREEPAQAKALLDAADDLRRAHEAAVGGDPDRGALKAAVAAERQAVGAIGRTAAAQAGGEVSADLERRIRDTLEAVALDADVREQFAAGRLEKDARASTLATDVPVKARPAAKRKRKADDERRRRADAADAVRAAEQSVDRRSADVEDAERVRARADAALREARERLKEAKAELRRARRRLG